MKTYDTQSAAEHWLRGNTVEATDVSERKWRVIAKCGNAPRDGEFDAGVFCSTGRHLFRVAKYWESLTTETAPLMAVWRHKQDPVGIYSEAFRYADGLMLFRGDWRDFYEWATLHEFWEWSTDGMQTWNRAGTEVEA